ncbi:unnamed protein product [Lathyrus sativus]|nr:unnamed protein product [Lathyrus sativus]
MVAEGLSGRVSNAIALGDFKGFHSNDNLSLGLLQFADDTVLVCDGSWKNLWSVKAVAGFLSCGIGSPSFSFLGIPIGINPRH